MMTSTQGKERVLELAKWGLEPIWLRNLRLEALAAYEQLPDDRFEKSDLSKRDLGSFHPQQGEVSCPEPFELVAPFQSQGQNRLVFANHRKIMHAKQPEVAEQGVLFTDLNMAARVFPTLVRPYLSKLIAVTASKWVALQTALWNTGLFLYVPRGVQVKVPLQAWWNRTVGGGQLHRRLLVVAEESSDVTLLVGEASALQEAALSLEVAEVYAKSNARVRIAFLQEQDERMTKVAHWRAQVERDAQVEWMYADMGQGYSVVEMASCLKGAGGVTRMCAVTLANGAQHLELTQRAEHLAPHTESRIQGRALVGEQARTTYRAVSQIEKGAVGTNSTQEERLLLLSKNAQAHPIPMLLISEEDVKCDHAVSVGQIPAEPLFYMMARGLTEKEAKKLLLQGFLSPLIDGMPIDGLREALEDGVERKMRL